MLQPWQNDREQTCKLVCHGPKLLGLGCRVLGFRVMDAHVVHLKASRQHFKPRQMQAFSGLGEHSPRKGESSGKEFDHVMDA